MTDVATVAPDRWINLKNNTKAKAVQKSARAIALNQLLNGGMLPGKRVNANGINTSPAPNKLPAEPTSCRTFCKRLFIQLAPKP